MSKIEYLLANKHDPHFNTRVKSSSTSLWRRPIIGRSWVDRRFTVDLNLLAPQKLTNFIYNFLQSVNFTHVIAVSFHSISF